MTRQREIPSIGYRSANQINMTFPIIPGVSKIRIVGASRLDDAYGAVAGVAGGGALPMFEVQSGMTYLSASVRARKLPAVEETNRKLTRMVFDLDDFATPELPKGATYLPTDDQTVFLRVQTWNSLTSAWNPAGPILIVPPYDFFTTKEPVLTVTGTSPNLGTGPWPIGIPDFMPPTVLNFLTTAYSASVSVVNLDPGKVLVLSFHPGVPPTVILPNTEFSITGAGLPEFFVGCTDGNPMFTVRMAVINSA